MTIENNAVINVQVCISFSFSVFFFFSENYPELELLGHIVVLFFNFLKLLQTVFHEMAAAIPAVNGGSLFSTSWPKFVVFR